MRERHNPAGIALQAGGRGRLTAVLVVIPLLLAVLAHAPALWSDIVWDDQRIAEQVAFFRGFADVMAPPSGIPAWSDAYFRPVVVLTYLVDFVFLYGPGAALGPHLTNLLLHAATTFFVWLLAARIFRTLARGDMAALAAAVLFAVHPVHTESVNWISGRSDVLATLFLLPAIGLALRWRDGASSATLAASVALLLLAMLAKEVAIVGLVIVPAAWLLVPAGEVGARSGLRRGPGFWLPGVGAMLAALAAYLLLRQMAGTSAARPLGLGAVVAVIGTTRVLGYYFTKLVFPWPQCNLVTWEMLPDWLSAGFVVLIVLLLAMQAFGRWRARGDGIPLFAVLWTVAALAPSLLVALVVTATGPVAERYLYLPSVGLAMAAGWGLTELIATRWRNLVAAGAVLVVVVFTATSWLRGLVWVSDVRLWSDATAKMPGHAFQWASLARAWQAAGDDARALDAYRAALDVESGTLERAKVMYGIGELRLARGELHQAEDEFRRALSTAPEFTRSAYGLGLVYLQQARDGESAAGWERAARQFEGALEMAPDFAEGRLGLAQARAGEATALVAQGRKAEARELLVAAVRLVNAVLNETPWPLLEPQLRDAGPGLETDVPAFRMRLVTELKQLDNPTGGITMPQ